MTSSHRTKEETSAALRLCEERFDSLVALSSDWYWEQDEHHRFSLFRGRMLEESGIDPDRQLGTRRWDHGGIPLHGGWEQHEATLDVHKPFADFIYKRINTLGVVCYISVSGLPVFDGNGRFQGYRGTAKDVTKRVETERRIAIEHAVARILANADNLADATPRVLRETCELLGWACGARWESDGHSDASRCVQTWGVAGDGDIEAFLASLRSVPALRPNDPGQRRSTGTETNWIADFGTATECRYAPRALAAGLHSAFSIAIPTATSAIDVLEFFSRETNKPDPELLSCIGFIGDQIAQFCQRTRAEERMREIGSRFQHLTELSSDWYWQQDDAYRFTHDSRADQHKTGLDLEEVIGKTHWELPFVDVTPKQWADLKTALDAREPFYDLVLSHKGKDGPLRYFCLSGRPFFDDNGRFQGYRGIGKDITERKLAEERVQYLATHDSLTALPNRAMFNEVLGIALQSARRYKHGFAVMFVDLDRFKNINDTFGHEVGDDLLKEIGARLTHTMRASDVVARLGGDEFVILVQNVNEPKYVATVARKILGAIMKPLVLLGQECRITGSVGICMYPADAPDEQTLMKHADIAMYRAKEEGKNNFQFYSEQINVHTLERMALETSLRRALERDEFHLDYQAKLDFKTQKITGVEALLRCNHPELGVVAPAQFIPLAEETGLIVPIGKWVLHTACAQNVAWQRQGLPPLCMAVNLSWRQFSEEDLLSDIVAALDETGLEPSLLELELTESMVVQNPERATRVLAAIKNLGVRLAIDDFGVGYSSLAQIKRFPIDTLKVDRSFIRDIPQNTDDNAIAEAIIAMGKTLSLTIVAEGVETPEQEKFLREHACDEMQGYYFSRPISADKFAELLRQHVPKPQPG